MIQRKVCRSLYNSYIAIVTVINGDYKLMCVRVHAAVMVFSKDTVNVCWKWEEYI